MMIACHTYRSALTESCQCKAIIFKGLCIRNSVAYTCDVRTNLDEAYRVFER